MTEGEWWDATDPALMLRFLGDRVSDRKLLLFGCACCRRIWDFLPTEACWKGVEIAERSADGRATNQELSAAQAAVIASAEKNGIRLFDDFEQESIEWGAVPGGLAFLAVVDLLGGRVEDAWVASRAAQEVAWDGARWEKGPEAVRRVFAEDWSVERAAQAALLRDILGHPFRPILVNPAWLAWNDGTIPQLAEAIYEEQAFERLPILADALEEGGCHDGDILTHCRQPGAVHVRGCWVVDQLTGRR